MTSALLCGGRTADELPLLQVQVGRDPLETWEHLGRLLDTGKLKVFFGCEVLVQNFEQDIDTHRKEKRE